MTFNLVDFPGGELSRFGIEARHPDDFVLEILDLAPDAVCAVVKVQAAALKNPTTTLGQLLATLQAVGLPQSVARLRELFGPDAVP